MPDEAPGARRSVTILGSSCSIPRPGRACSSYLIEGLGHSIVVDLGSGALANLHRHRRAEEIDAVFISHMHADHFLDVIPLRYALKYGERGNDRKVPLYLPPGGEEMLRRLVDAFARESRHDFLDEVFEVRTYDARGVVHIGDTAVSFAPTTHYIPTFAIRCDLDGASVTYSADTAPDSGIAAFARACDLFLCEATLVPSDVEEGARGHLSASEAAQLAATGEVRRLVLTHYPASTGAAELRTLAKPVFTGELAIADDNDRFEL
ncbi:MAG: MBL fold metallo-hydrolase [Candidatus Baltobacteraceae bacterium]|jgi:ribonuclease BN (tRNA processing enzyme)